MQNINQGHRQRLRERYLSEGLDGFKDHEVLELLLFQYIPYKDTNKIAHSLIERFGTLANVLEASPDQLKQVKGISDVTAVNIALLRDVWYRYNKSVLQSKPLDNLSDVMIYAKQLLRHSTCERMIVVYVDSASNFLKKTEYSSNNANTILVTPKQIVTEAVQYNASGVMLFHCHVKGTTQPSNDDNDFTEKLFVTLSGINVALIDHIILGEDEDYYSYFENKRLQYLLKKYNETSD